MSSRGLGVDRAAREASRLVFVYVRDSKPRRKVAVPVPDSLTWDQFLATIQAKLKVGSIADIYLSGSGQRVRRVDELQDIDELCVVDGGAPDAGGAGGAAAEGGVPGDGGGGGGGGGGLGGRHSSSSHRIGIADAGIGPSNSNGSAGGAAVVAAQAAQAATGLLAGALSGALSGGVSALGGAAAGGPRSSFDGADEADTKYVRRQGAARRTLQSLFPALFQASGALPVSLRDGAGAGGAGAGAAGGARGGPPLPRVRSARPGGGRAGSAGGLPPRPSARRRALRLLLALLAAASAVGALVFLFARSHPDSDLPEGVRAFEREVETAEKVAAAGLRRAESAAAEEYHKVAGALGRGR